MIAPPGYNRGGSSGGSGGSGTRRSGGGSRVKLLAGLLIGCICAGMCVGVLYVIVHRMTALGAMSGGVGRTSGMGVKGTPASKVDASRADDLEVLLAEKEAKLELAEFRLQRVITERTQLERRTKELEHELEGLKGEDVEGHEVEDHQLPELPPSLGDDPFLVWDNDAYRPALADYEQLREDKSVRTVYHVVSHTHWDREWYLPFETFRGRLVGLLDRIIASIRDRAHTKFMHFHLDGQSIVADDYLEVHPQMRQVILQLNSAGHLSLGPWYVQPDEFLVSGEALVRNLLLGMRVARFYGGTSLVGYIPDSFGHIAQMPQILLGFGMTSCVSGRGPTGQIPTESVWTGADHSEVLFIYMKDWYCNALTVPPADSGGIAQWMRSKGSAVASRTRHLLLMNGCDHSSPSADVGAAVAAADEAMKPQGERVVHSNLDDYVSLVQEELQPQLASLPRQVGELRYGVDHLVNTLSNQMHQKQANTAIQQLLERWAEPLATIDWVLRGLPFSQTSKPSKSSSSSSSSSSSLKIGENPEEENGGGEEDLFVGGGFQTKVGSGAEPGDYPRDTLWYAWRILMQNHPHDSICGCSADDVHSEVDARFRKVQQVVEQQVTLTSSRLFHWDSKLLRTWLKQDGPTAVAFNPLATSRHEVVVAELDLPQTLVNVDMVHVQTGKAVPTTLLSSEHVWTYELPDIGFRRHSNVNRVRVAFLAEMPALGFSVYQLRARTAEKESSTTYQVRDSNDGKATMENEHVRVRVHDDGRVDVTDKARKVEYSGLNRLVSVGDGGDQYHFQQMGGESALGRGQIRSALTFATHHVVHVQAELPVRTGGALAVNVYVVLRKGSRRVEFRVELTNSASDHRVSVQFPSAPGIASVESDSHFETIRRSPPHGFLPQLGYTAVLPADPAAAAFTVANRGLPEFWVQGQTYCMTLLRATGRIGDWGTFPTPTAQVHREFAFEYAFLPHAGSLAANPDIAREARQFAEPAAGIQARRYDGYVPRPLVDLLDHSELSHLAHAHPNSVAAMTGLEVREEPVGTSFFELLPSSLVLTSVKKADARSSVIVRLYNPFEEPVQASLSTALQFSRAFLCRLDETRIREEIISTTDARPLVSFSVGPKKIVTIELV